MSKPISIEGSIQNNFDRIYVTYYSRMLRFAREYVLFEEDAENVVQDVFLLLWEKREVLDIQISLVSYLFSACEKPGALIIFVIKWWRRNTSRN